MENSIKSQNKIFTIFITLTLVVTFGFLFFSFKDNIKHIYGDGDQPHVVLNGEKIRVEVVDQYQEQVQGLSGREVLADKSGMLFDFKNKQQRRFWMKNMNFPIDIIWISDNKIVNISKNCQPEGENPSKRYNSNFPVNYVLEVNAGLSDELGIKIGDEVDFKF